MIDWGLLVTMAFVGLFFLWMILEMIVQSESDEFRIEW